jgi:hypothetical protein
MRELPSVAAVLSLFARPESAALMRMAGDLPEQSDTWPRGWIGNDLIRLPGRKEPSCSFRCRDSFVDANHLSQADSEDFERGGQQVG